MYPDDLTRYELPPSGITLLGYIVRRMHKTRWLEPVPGLIAAGRAVEALAHVALCAVRASTSFGRAYYQPVFNAVGEEVSEPDPLTGAVVRARLESASPHHLMSYSTGMPDGCRFETREEITGTTIVLRGQGMPAPTDFRFTSGDYSTALLDTRIRAHGFLNFTGSAGNAGRITLDRNNRGQLGANGVNWEKASPYSVERVPA